MAISRTRPFRFRTAAGSSPAAVKTEYRLPTCSGIIRMLESAYPSARNSSRSGPDEPVTGTNGVLIPPDGYLHGVRELCTRYGIAMIADEVMCGFGRTGEWFAVNHWDVVPDLMTAAKGLTSSYLPLGAVAMSPVIAEHFEDNVFFGGLTYNAHPLSCAAALAAIDVLEQDDLIGNAKRLEPVMRSHHEELAARHPSVGLHRNIGLFGILVVLIVLFVPAGLMDLFTRRWSFLALGRRVATAGGAR